jgi:hypothetical protein
MGVVKMSITYCSRISCGKFSCPYNQYNAPKGVDISLADRNDGCYGLSENPDKFYYCMMSDCIKKDCRFHLTRAPEGVAVEATDQDLGCYVGPNNRRKDLLKAICRGTQKTNYKCDDTCKALCGNDGTCAYCSIIADSIEEACLT